MPSLAKLGHIALTTPDMEKSPCEILNERILTAGYHTHLLHAGEGHHECMLLLHGGGPGAQAQSNWMPTLPAFGEHAHTIAPDLLGFGDTDHPDPPPSGPRAWLALRVEQLLGILDHYGHERATVVGNSLGGALTLNLVLAHPERVERIVLMGSAGGPFPPGPDLIRLLRFYGHPTVENLRGVLRSFVYDLERFGDVEHLVQQRLHAARREEVRRSFEAMFRSEDGQPVGELTLRAETIASITHEALVVHGREDKIIPPQASHWLFEHLPNANLHLFSRCGHWAMLEQPGRFNRLVLDFVTEASEQVHA
jgi:2-hydroxymuconate-semialdehyde hydrolase